MIGLEGSALQPDRLDLGGLLRYLAARQYATNVLVEGGGVLMGSLLRQGLLDQILVFVAPKLAGDASAVPALQGLTLEKISNAPPLTLHGTKKFGEDILLDYRVNHPADPPPKSKNDDVKTNRK